MPIERLRVCVVAPIGKIPRHDAVQHFDHRVVARGKAHHERCGVYVRYQVMHTECVRDTPRYYVGIARLPQQKDAAAQIASVVDR